MLAKPGAMSPECVVFAAGLLNTRATLAEAALYSDAAWLDSVASKIPHFMDRVAARIQSMPQAVPVADYGTRSKYLKPLLDRSKGYPVDVSASALNALIQIDVAIREPISEALWQITPNGG